MESTYQTCVAFELRSAGLDVRTEVVLPIVYGGARIDVGYRVDMLIDGMVIIENKAVERLLRVHTAQILTYLQLSGFKLGFLLNWNVRLMKHGISRFVIDY
jgi:GxxExxY protein